MRVYDLYLFDFDNTLFDTRPGFEAVLRGALPAIGLEYDPSMFRVYQGLSREGVFERYAGSNDSYEEFRRRFDGILYSEASYRGALPFPDTERTLRGLKARGKRIGIASGKMTYKIENLMEDNGLGGLVETIVGYGDTDRSKPDPEPIALAFSRFDVPKERAIYVGDSDVDALASRAFGIDCAIIDRPDGACSEPCEYHLASLEELLDWRSQRALAREPHQKPLGLLDSGLCGAHQ